MNKAKREKQVKRVRAKLRHATRPRLSVFVSNKHIYAQIIDDHKGETIVSVSDVGMESSKNIKVAQKIGELIAVKAKEKKVKEVVFDRGGKKYHGRVKVLAESAREHGLVF
ncbi:MAG: 50S ribosomal protein L18 [Candidatus Blackburnbacteria bacterium]|nr:50S ribosomal protein L18 [Candidatus Blackburnbacteria bacterium]